MLLDSMQPLCKTRFMSRPIPDHTIVSSQRLRAWLGIDRATFYDAAKIAILPMGFCYPGSGAGGDLAPRAECAPQWRAALLRQMAGHDANPPMRVIGRSEERKSVDMIPVRMRQKQVDGADVMLQEYLADTPDTGPGIEDEPVFANGDLNAARIAAKLHMMW